MPISKLGVHTVLNFCAAIPFLGKIANATKDTMGDVDQCISEIKKYEENIFTEQLDSFASLSEHIKHFSDALSSMSPSPSKETSEEEITKIILVDEIDRCKPSFAINLLEIIKHFFSTPNTVFIITMDKHALSEHIKHYHGYNIDANHYLSRLFDYELNLPANSDHFYQQLMSGCSEGKNIYDESLMHQIRKLYGFGPREWKKYLITIKHIKKIPTWNRVEVYILLAVKMWDVNNYTDLSRLNFLPNESKNVILTKMLPNYSSVVVWEEKKSEIGGHLGKALGELVDYFMIVNDEKLMQEQKVKDLTALNKAALMGIFSVIDCMG